MQYKPLLESPIKLLSPLTDRKIKIFNIMGMVDARHLRILSHRLAPRGDFTDRNNVHEFMVTPTKQGYCITLHFKDAGPPAGKRARQEIFTYANMLMVQLRAERMPSADPHEIRFTKFQRMDRSKDNSPVSAHFDTFAEARNCLADLKSLGLPVMPLSDKLIEAGLEYDQRIAAETKPHGTLETEEHSTHENKRAKRNHKTPRQK